MRKSLYTGLILIALISLVAYQIWTSGRQDPPIPPADWLTPLPTYRANLPPTPHSPTPPSPSPTPAVPTPTATRPTPSPMPSATATPTPAPIPLQAEGYLHCRTGPAPFYPSLAVLQPGEQVLAVGYAPFEPDEARYWYVALMDSRLCWVRESRYLSFPPAARPDALPRYPTPPVPELAFTVRFAGHARCGSRHGWLFQVTNYGTRAIESMAITFAQGAAGARWDTRLTWWRDCQTRSGGPAIQPGRHLFLTVDDAPTTSGQAFTATVRACARDYLRAPCAEQTLSFRP